MNTYEAEDMMTVKEVAAWFRFHVNTVYEMASRGELPSVKSGNSIRFSKTELLAWLREHKRVPVG